jgi:hypothetical protein
MEVRGQNYPAAEVVPRKKLNNLFWNIEADLERNQVSPEMY